MNISASFKILFLWFMIAFVNMNVHGQSNMDSSDVKNKLVALRDDFISRIEAMGYHPILKSPEIVMDNPPSFGKYDDSANIIHTSNWNTLPDNDKEVFTRAGKRFGYTGESYFENTAHRWIFIHELGHWWRASQHQIADSYSSEMAANRIDIAYWRETDTAYSRFSRQRFEVYLKLMPNPVPEGQDKEKYLNENYGKLPVSTYIWYQATMIVNGYEEKPITTFKDAIKLAGNKN